VIVHDGEGASTALLVVCDWSRKSNKLKAAFFDQSQTTSHAVIYTNAAHVDLVAILVEKENVF